MVALTLHQNRSKPNVLITGTPGTGKTTTCELLSLATNMRHVNVGEWVREKGFQDGYNDEFDAHYIDEDKLLDAMEEIMGEGGCIVDHHTCDFFPERWFDLVVVLQTDNSVLYSRLEKR